MTMEKNGVDMKLGWLFGRGSRTSPVATITCARAVARGHGTDRMKQGRKRFPGCEAWQAHARCVARVS
ncbi:hypothetical protein ASD22_04875 [Rhodanobacter sp. Root480]|nr:hypothetical protein ASD22_04875 [Rhodanobacter sp. Root480]KRA35784.1 hypothetical protein ASD68_05220 [Rhodanobacter sp. Root627]